MKKLLVITGLIVLIAASCNNQPTPTPTPAPAPTPTPAPTPAPAPTSQIYSNTTYGFKFEYPIYLTFVSPSYANLQDKIVQVQIPQSQYAGTNFGDAAVAVSASAAKTLAACLKLSPPENGDGFKTKVAINGTDFYMTKSSGVGAGNIYESTVYRTIKNPGSACIEISETIHTSNIANYPAGTVTEVDKTHIQTILDSALNTFQFSQ